MTKDFFKVSGSGENFQFLEVSKFPGRNRAYGYLNKLNKKLDNDPVVSSDVAKRIKKSVEVVRKKCQSKHSFIYKVQSKFNPFSQAYKIEKLSSKIISKLDDPMFIKKQKQHDEVILDQKIKENNDKPFEFFNCDNHIFYNASDRVNNEGEGVLYYFPDGALGHGTPAKSKHIAFTIKDHDRGYLKVSFKLDKEKKAIQLIENSIDRRCKSSANKHCKDIMIMMKNGYVYEERIYGNRNIFKL